MGGSRYCFDTYSKQKNAISASAKTADITFFLLNPNNMIFFAHETENARLGSVAVRSGALSGVFNFCITTRQNSTLFCRPLVVLSKSNASLVLFLGAVRRLKPQVPHNI